MRNKIVESWPVPASQPCHLGVVDNCASSQLQQAIAEHFRNLISEWEARATQYGGVRSLTYFIYGIYKDLLIGRAAVAPHAQLSSRMHACDLLHTSVMWVAGYKNHKHLNDAGSCRRFRATLDHSAEASRRSAF